MREENKQGLLYSYVLKCIVIVSAVVGIILSARGGRNSFMGAIGFTGELPFMGCVWWILLLLFFLLGVGQLYLSILKKLKK